MAAEGDAFLVTRQPTKETAALKPSSSSSPAAAAAAAAVAKAAAAKAEAETGPPLPSLRVSSNMARFEPEYELVLKSRVGRGRRASSSSSSAVQVVEARSQRKATSFFRSDGTMDSAALQKEVEALLDEIEAKVAKSDGGGGGGGGSRRARSSPRTKKN